MKRRVQCNTILMDLEELDDEYCSIIGSRASKLYMSQETFNWLRTRIISDKCFVDFAIEIEYGRCIAKYRGLDIEILKDIKDGIVIITQYRFPYELFSTGVCHE